MAEQVIDRSAAVRAALRALVAERGLHGTSMAAVAARAGVATGTAYTYYRSKTELVFAAYCELKSELAAAAVTGLDPALPPAERFRQLWLRFHDFLVAEPERARFLTQMENSPLAAEAHARAAGAEDPMLAEAARADLQGLLVDLPLLALFDLGFGPAIRTAASGTVLTAAQRDVLAAACWRASTNP